MKCNLYGLSTDTRDLRLSNGSRNGNGFLEIMECAEVAKIKFAAATLQGRALTWWNSQVAMMGLEAANQIGNGPSERKKIEAYIRGLTDNIKGTVIGSKPISLNEAVRMAHALMEQKSQARIERIAEGNKRKWESSQGGNNGNNRNNNRDNTRHNQQNNQRQGNARAMTTAPAEQGGYAGNKPLCNRCKKKASLYVSCRCGKVTTVEQAGHKVTRILIQTPLSYVQESMHNPQDKDVRNCGADRAHVTEKEPKEKRLEDVPGFEYIPEYFPDDLPGLHHLGQVEFKNGTCTKVLQHTARTMGKHQLIRKEEDGIIPLCIDYRELKKVVLVKESVSTRVRGFDDTDLDSTSRFPACTQRFDQRSGYHQLPN
ncbi:hypothetical protein Tco_0105486 [Tanacetum coccineum]